MCPSVVSSQPDRRTWLVSALLLVGLTVGAYIPALNGGFIWDDDDYVQDNLTLRSLAGLGQIWFQPGATRQYYPLVHTTYWLEYRLWGLNPTGYHVVNVILHALSAVLVWRLLIRLQVPGAWAAAALFALHPVHVESVAWITERKNTLSGAFYLSAAWAYLRYEEARTPSFVLDCSWPFLPRPCSAKPSPAPCRPPYCWCCGGRAKRPCDARQ